MGLGCRCHEVWALKESQHYPTAESDPQANHNGIQRDCNFFSAGLAVTSGMRLEVLSDAARNPMSVVTSYEDCKRGHQDTLAECQGQGISFFPMVVEAVGGGWGAVAKSVWSELAKSSALASGEFISESTVGIKLLQQLSMILHRENARACLGRYAS